MNKILCFFEYEKVKEEFSKRFEKKDITFLKGNVQDFEKKEGFEKVQILSVFISSILDKKNIDKFENLKLIVTRSTGTDHIDLKYAQKKGIKVLNIKNYGGTTVAEYGFGLLLEISKKINKANFEVRKNKNFSARGIHNIESFELENKKIGIIGTGMIGKKMIKIAQGFGMEVLAFDKFEDSEYAKKNNFKYVDFENLLKNSDIISLHLPLLESTRYILAKKEFQKMKENVVIINTARGALIKTKDFYDFLENGKILAAGLDVLENEDSLGRELFFKEKNTEIEKINKKIIEMKNVVVTPHNAFNSKEASERRIEMTVRKIKEFL